MENMEDNSVVAYFNKETKKAEVKVSTHKTITGEIVRTHSDVKSDKNKK